jgi:hypothetical protein
MAYEGMLANAAVTAFASGLFLDLAFEVRRRRVRVEPRALAAAILFGVIGLHLALAALRQVVAFASAGSPAIARLEAPLFFATVIPAALTIVPLAYMATWALTGQERASRLVTGAFLTAATVGTILVFQQGIEGPSVSFWASEWTIVSLPARVMILLVMTIPAFAASAVLMRAGRGRLDAASRRARLVGWSCLVYYAAFTFDALGEPGVWLLVERTAMAIAAIIGWRAYFPGRAATAAALAREEAQT